MNFWAGDYIAMHWTIGHEAWTVWREVWTIRHEARTIGNKAWTLQLMHEMWSDASDVVYWA